MPCIIAGDTSATIALRCYLLSPVKSHYAKHPNVLLDVLIDDLSFYSTSKSTPSLVHNLSEALLGFSDNLESNLGLELARSKPAVVADDQAVALQLRKALGIGGLPDSAQSGLWVLLSPAVAGRSPGSHLWPAPG